MAQINNPRSLSENLTNSQENYTTKVVKKEKSTADFYQQQQQLLINMIKLQAKHPNIGENSSNNSGMELMSQVQKLMSDQKYVETQEKLAQAAKSNKLPESANLVGKNVEYDCSSKTWNTKSPVIFTYNVPRIPANLSYDLAEISIMNAHGQKVYTTKEYGLQNGKNDFTWDGRNNAGKPMNQGDYKISVKCFGFTNTGMKIPIKSTTSSGARVETVDIDGDKLTLNLSDGNAIASDQISRMLGDATVNTTSDIEPDHTLMQYIGKEVVIDNSIFEVKSGNAQIAYNNDSTDELKDIKLDISNDGRYVKTIELTEKLKLGLNKLDIDLKKHGINDGKYICSISGFNSKLEQRITLNSELPIVVSSVDVKAGEFIDKNGNRYSASNIKEAKNVVPEEIDKIAAIKSRYQGKQIESMYKPFVYQKDHKIDLSLDLPAEGRIYGAVTVKIMDGNAQELHTVSVPANKVYHRESEPIPDYNSLAGLHLDKFKDKKGDISGNRDIEYSSLSVEQKRLMDQWIAEEFRGGRLFQQQNPTDEQLLRNQGKMEINLGEIPADKGIKDGENLMYAVEFVTTKINGDDRQSKVIIHSDIVQDVEVTEDEQVLLSLGEVGQINAKYLLE